MEQLILILGGLGIAGLMSRTLPMRQFSVQVDELFLVRQLGQRRPSRLLVRRQRCGLPARRLERHHRRGDLDLDRRQHAGTEPQDLNFELDYRSTPTSAWTVITNSLPLSTGVAYSDVNVMGRCLPGLLAGRGRRNGSGK